MFDFVELAPVNWALVADVVWPIGGAVVLGLGLHRAVLIIARRMQQRDSRRGRIVRTVALPLAFAVPLAVLGLAVGLTPLPDDAVGPVITVIRLGVFGCAIWLAVRIIAAIEASIRRRHPIDVADNYAARRLHTQAHVLSRVTAGLVILLGTAMALMTLPSVRQVGSALLASAGIAGIAVGIAAKPVFTNLIAGLQIALAQPIRLDDVVIVDGEWGRIEEIGSTFVTVRIWDERRMVVPLAWFIENPFQNWTRRTADLLGSAFLWLDYHTPMAAIRAELERICESDPRWDGRVCVAQVTETTERTMQVRLLVSARNSGEAFELRCVVRERMIEFLAREHPEALPRVRASLDHSARDGSTSSLPATAPVAPSCPPHTAAQNSSAPHLRLRGE